MQDVAAELQVLEWQKKVRWDAKSDRDGHRVRTMLGRHRSLPGYEPGRSSAEESHASRAAINTPVQGSAADVVAAAMVRIHEDPMLKEIGWKMLLQVHDEVRTSFSDKLNDEKCNVIIVDSKQGMPMVCQQ